MFIRPYPGAIREVSFSMGDGATTVFSGTRVGTFGSMQVSDAPGSDRLSFNQMTLTPSQLEGEVPTVTNGPAMRTFNNATLALGLTGPNTSISSQLLPAAFDQSLFANTRQLSVFLSYTQQGTGSGPWPAVSYNYNLNSVDVATVPVPPAGLLLFAGLGAMGFAARRQRRG